MKMSIKLDRKVTCLYAKKVMNEKDNWEHEPIFKLACFKNAFSSEITILAGQ
jgi:hypothetical protein